MPDPRRTALFIVNSLAGGGAERVLTTLIAASGPWRDRFDIHLALLDDEPRAYSPPDWVKTWQLDARGRLPASVTQLRRLTQRLKPDVTMSFLTRANVASAAAMAGSGRPWLISERVNTSAHLGRGRGAVAARAMVRLTYPRASRIVAVSEGVAEDLTANFGVRRERVVAIPNPVDHAAIARAAAAPPAFVPAGPYLIATGRLVPNKNFAMLLDAYARAALPLRLVIMGEGPARAALEAQARALGIADRIDMPGFVENPFAMLARAAMFALPSNAEGFPNGLVEAMACGLPVVATNCASGPSEILADQPRGAVAGAIDVPAGALVPTDDAEAFAAALNRVHGQAAARDCGAAARRRSLDYGVERAAAAYWAEIEAAFAARTGAAARGTNKTMTMQSGAMG